MDFVVSVVTCTLDKLMGETISQARYPFRFSKYVKELEIEKENLQSKIQEHLDCAKDAKKKTHKVVSEVEMWFNKADFLMAEVVKLLEKTKKRNKTYCLKHCPNLVSRFNMAKQLEGKTNKIRTHIKIEFPVISRSASLVGMDYFSSDFVSFDSRKVDYDRLLMALKDGKIYMIGLYGMGGSGKTILATEVGKEAEKFFDKVLFVAVSKTFNVREIQNKIADQLSLKLEEKENAERAKRLFMRLSGGERFLIILDDVWEELNFKDIGIPTTNDQMGCTITLITTRNFHVCKSMKCQKVIHLEGLNEDESWVLFHKYAGLLDDHYNNLMDVAQKITEQCGGLPIAIAAVASALKGNHNREEWLEALKTLRDPCWIDIEEEGLKSTYRCLRLSYDNLEDKVAKSVFLLCSVYPEDYEIAIDQLTSIGLGLGLAREFPSYRTRTQVINKAIKKLIDSCLLLKCREDGNHVKMHDLVRDVAIWIGKENKLIVGQLKEEVIMNEHAVRYLWFEVVGKTPNKLNCPELEFFYVSIYSKHCVTIPNDFFNGMENLRVLILKNPNYYEDIALPLPIPVHSINNLCSLMLYSWELGDISSIRSSERLESLTICNCSFEELPECIIQQKSLRLLELLDCNIQRSPFETMGRCSQLEELSFCRNQGRDWGCQNKNSAEFFNKFSTTTPALENYCIHFGENDIDDFDQAVYKHFLARSLYIEDFESCISIEKSKDMMRRAKTLSLRGIHKSCKNIIPDIWQTLGGGMNELTQLKLSDSNGIECVIGHANNPSQVKIICNLTHLALVRVNHLKTLYNGEPPQGFFANLEYLYIQSCGSLEHILTEDGKEIVDASEYQIYKNAFPKLKRLQTMFCEKLEYLMPISSAKSLAHLEYLRVDSNDKMRIMFGQSLHEEFNLNKPHIIEFSALKTLNLKKLPNIISICPENYHPTWPILKNLKLHDCPQLNITSMKGVACVWQEEGQIISEDLLEALQEVEVAFDVEQLRTNEQQVNYSIRDLYVRMLPELRHIWRGPKNSLNLQNLQFLRLESCGNLKEVFSLSVLKCLPQLRTLHIKDCNELEEIIDDQNVSNSHQIVFPRLAIIFIRQCHKLKYVFPNIATYQVVPNLTVLAIEDASVLEQVFGHEEHDVTTLEYVLLWNLPSLTSVIPSIALKNVRYIVVQQCPKLSLASSVTPHKMLEQLSKGYFTWDLMLMERLNVLIETTQQIDCQETWSQSNSQKLTIITSSNFAENKKESEGQSEHKREMLEEKSSVEGRAEECTILENVQMVTSLAHPGSTNDGKGSFEGSLSSSENTEIITSSVDLKLVSSPPGILVASSTNTVPSSVEGRVEECTTSETVQIFTSLSHPEPECSTKGVRDLEGQSAQKENISTESVENVEGNFESPLSSENAETVTLSTDSKLANLLPGILVTSTTNTVPHHMKESEDQSAHEEDMLQEKSVGGRDENYSTSENVQIITSLAHSELASSTMDVTSSPSTDSKSESLLPGILITSSTNTISHVQNQIKLNPRKSDVEDLKDDDLISVLEIMEDVYGGKSPKSSVPTSKDRLVSKALADLEDSLKMPLKDIATSEANRLRLQTALNFLSHISLEDGALPHGVMAIIKSLYNDLPHILSSFNQAHAAVNKFAVLEERDKSIKYELSQRKEFAISLVSKMSEAQEKEARLKEQISRLEKERKDCEDELLSLQDQKRKYIAETVEFKKEIETVKKEKSEMVEDQRNTQQQLFQVDHKWSVLARQFENNNAYRKTE